MADIDRVATMEGNTCTLSNTDFLWKIKIWNFKLTKKLYSIWVQWHRYRPSNDGKYVHDDDKYVHTKDQFGGFGASGRTDGVVNIGGPKPRPPTTTKPTPTAARTITTKSPLPPSPSPSIYVIDNNRNNAVSNRNQDLGDDLSQPKAGTKIIRQEQEASENGYHYL